MGLVVILLVILTLIVFSEGKDRRKKEIAREHLGIKKPTVIRFDKKSVRRQKKINIILSIFVAVVLLLFVAGLLAGVVISKEYIMVVVFVVVAMAAYMIPLIIGLWLQWFYGTLYLKNLAKHGFLVPEQMEEYYCAVEGLPREDKTVDDGSIIPADGTQGRNIESIWLSTLCGITAFILIWLGIEFYQRWNFWAGKTWVFYIVLAAFWIIGTIVYAVQSDEKTFRDEVEYYSKRHKRKSLGAGLIQYYQLILFTGALAATVWFLTPSIYKSEVKFDIHNLEKTVEVAQMIYDAHKAVSPEWDEYDEILKAGVDVMTLEPEDSKFADEFYWTMKDFTELERLRNGVIVDGAVYKLTLVDGKIEGIYSNVYEGTDK